MKHSPRHRKPADLSNSIHKRLTSYALAANAAGVGILALSHGAEAKIVYKAAHHLIGKNAHYALDLNHDGIADFTFVNLYGCNFDYCYDGLNANAAAGNGVEGKRGFLNKPYAYVVPPGSQIGPKQPFSGQLMAYAGMGSSGRWINVNKGYLGLKFQIKNKTHYGWARLNVHLTQGVIDALLTGYAYETIPNKAIIAGRTKEPDFVAKPATLGHLSAGASGTHKIPFRPR